MKLFVCFKDFQTWLLFLLVEASRVFLVGRIFPSCWLVAGGENKWNLQRVFFPIESHETRCLLKFSGMTSRTQTMQFGMELVFPDNFLKMANFRIPVGDFQPPTKCIPVTTTNHSPLLRSTKARCFKGRCHRGSWGGFRAARTGETVLLGKKKLPIFHPRFTKGRKKGRHGYHVSSVQLLYQNFYHHRNVTFNPSGDGFFVNTTRGGKKKSRSFWLVGFFPKFDPAKFVSKIFGGWPG